MLKNPTYDVSSSPICENTSAPSKEVAGLPVVCTMRISLTCGCFAAILAIAHARLLPNQLPIVDLNYAIHQGSIDVSHDAQK